MGGRAPEHNSGFRHRIEPEQYTGRDVENRGQLEDLAGPQPALLALYQRNFDMTVFTETHLVRHGRLGESRAQARRSHPVTETT